MHTRKTCASAVVAFCFTTTFKPYYSSIFGTTLVALSSLQTHAWSLWSFTCFRICCSHLCTLTFVLLYVSSHICALICVLLLSFHVMPCSICSSLHYLGSLAGVIFKSLPQALHLQCIEFIKPSFAPSLPHSSSRPSLRILTTFCAAASWRDLFLPVVSDAKKHNPKKKKTYIRFCVPFSGSLTALAAPFVEFPRC